MMRPAFLALGLGLGACVASDPGDAHDPAPAGGGKADGVACPNDPSGTVALATAQVWPGSVAVDESHVYWLSSGSGSAAGSVWSTTACAGGTAEQLADGQSVPRDLELDASSLYWVTYDAGSPHGTVMKRAKSGGVPDPLALDQRGPIALALHDDDVYFMTLGALMRVPADGSSPPEQLSTMTCPHGGLVIDDEHVYWTEDCVMFGTPRIARWSTSGSETVLAGDGAPQRFAADATHLYWTRWALDGLHVERVEKDCEASCAPETIAMADGYGGSVAVDNANVYFSAKPDESIYMVPKAGGTPVALATNDNKVSSIAVRGGVVYWTVQGAGGGVYKVSLPEP